MAVDHSQTYRLNKVINIAHVYRLRKILAVLQLQMKGHKVERYADYGCSNGFITNKIHEEFVQGESFGFDFSDNIDIAKEKYREIKFKIKNLNIVSQESDSFDLITCFETLEHVGNMRNALNTILDSRAYDGVALMTVPIEIGFIGILKYVLKRSLYRYDLPLNCGDMTYLHALMFGKDISQFRFEAEGYPSHFGFDYRRVDDLLSERNEVYSAFNSLTTRFYIISNDASYVKEPS